jgi:hypothetical protein
MLKSLVVGGEKTPIKDYLPAWDQSLLANP